jgi:hypothetical protein
MASQTNSTSVEITYLDFQGIRRDRQTNNVTKTYNCLINDKRDEFYKLINIKIYEEHKKKYGYTDDYIFEKCKTCDVAASSLCELVSKKASRQGNKDETLQIKTCNDLCKKKQIDISINSLSNKALRPTKDGQIVSKIEMKDKSISKDLCLKSFDAEISGKINGFVCAKVCYGSGGHQDNVFEEMDTFCEWWKKYKFNTNEILVILIDTDLEKKQLRLKKKFDGINNIKIFNHIDFQQYLLHLLTFQMPIFTA